MGRAQGRVYRGEIRKAKAHQKLNLTTIAKDKKYFSKQINNKSNTKENLPLLLDSAGNVITKDKEKAEVPHTFFTSVFYYLAMYPQGTEPPKLVYRDEEQNNPPSTIQEETETSFSTCTDTNL